jgi:hypothetical protein
VRVEIIDRFVESPLVVVVEEQFVGCLSAGGVEV